MPGLGNSKRSSHYEYRFVVSVAMSRGDSWQTIVFDFAPVATI
jgi:hypothetical protein